MLCVTAAGAWMEVGPFEVAAGVKGERERVLRSAEADGDGVIGGFDSGAEIG